MKSRWIGWAIGIVIVCIVGGIGIKSNLDLSSLLNTALNSVSEKQIPAIETLLQRDDIYDLFAAREPEQRVNAVQGLYSYIQQQEKIVDNAKALADQELANKPANAPDTPNIVKYKEESNKLDKAIGVLIKLGRDDESSVRDRVLNALKQLARTKTDAVAAGLKDSNSNAKNTSAAALMDLGEQAIPALINLIKDPSAQYNAVDTLTKMCETNKALKPAIIISLLPFVDDEEEKTRLFIIEALGKIGDESAVPAITKRIDDNLKTKNICISALGAIGSPKSESLLVSALSDVNMESAARAQAAVGLGMIVSKTGSPSTINVLVNTLTDLDNSVRTSVVTALQRAGSKALTALSVMIKSSNPRIREDAVTALSSSLSDPQAIAMIAAALKDADSHVRLAAVKAMGSSLSLEKPVFTSQQITYLASALNDNDGMVSTQASNELGKIGRQAIPTLISLLDTGSDNVRFLASDALGAIGEPALPELSNKLNNRWAVSALSKIASPKAQVLLEKAALNSDKNIQYIAKQALAENFGKLK